MDILQNRYQVEQQLGKKAGRQTVLARDLETQKLVVVKLLTFGTDFEWDDLKLFEREAETLRSLNHPAIPQYLDYFEVETATTKGFALVQSYIEAKSLEQHLKAGRSFTETEVKQLAESLLDILAYLHTQQPAVIHRDIKPSNILLGDRTGHHVGQVYLVDFGSVQTLVAQEGGTITVVGTYGYMPPEQYGGRATAASDLYSLGATLIYLVTGKHPADLPQRNLQLQFKAFATLSEPFSDWLEWLTEPSLENRLESAEIALEVLRQEQRRSPEAIEIVSKMTIDRLFWNAIWHSSLVVTIAGVGCALVLVLTHVLSLSLGYGFDFSNLLPALILAGVLWGGIGLSLGFFNGLLVAFLTHNFYKPEKTPFYYRLVVGIVPTLIIGAVTLALMNFASPLLFEVTRSLKLLAVLNLAMVATSQTIATWYIRESQKIASKNDLKLLPQSLRKPLEKIQEEKLESVLVSTNRSAKLQRIKRKLAPALTKERVLWNAIWRFSTVGASVSAVLFATYAKFSFSYATDWKTVALNMVLAAITGGSLGLGLGFLNGLLSGLLTLRSMLQNRRLYRWRVGLLVSLFSAGLVYGFLLLSSVNWIPFPLFIMILAGSMGLTTQSFMRWYLQETRFKPLAKLKSKVRVIAAKSRSR